MVGMLLSYALNQAIETRSNLKEYLQVFKIYNHKKLKLHYEKVADITPKKTTPPLDDHDGGSSELKKCDSETDETLETYFPSLDTIKHAFFEEQNAVVDILKNITQQDCIPGLESSKVHWKNIHTAAKLVMELVLRFMILSDQNEEKLRADYDQYNDYGIIDAFSLHRQNKLMLLYVLVFLVLNPNTSEAKLFENFEDDEKLYTFLMDVEVGDFVALVPVIRLFFEMHKDDMCLKKCEDAHKHKRSGDPHERCNNGNDINSCYHDVVRNKDGTIHFGKFCCFWDTDGGMVSCLENMIDWFLKRSFLEQANETGFNVYTAANVYFYAQRNAEAKADVLRWKTLRNSMSTTSKDNRLLAAQSKGADDYGSTESDSGKDGIQKGWDWYKFFRRSFLVTMFVGYDAGQSQKADYTEGKEKTDCKEGKNEKDFQEERKKIKQAAEVQSSIERAITCFLLQGGLYMGSLCLSRDKACYEDSGLIGENFKDVMSAIIIFFAFQYLTTMSISEFYINTFSFIQDTKSSIQKGLMCLNIFVNSLFTLSMIYSTAVILRSSGSFLDLALNAVAIFFISDLDDMMISEIDEYALNARVVEALIGLMRDLSEKRDVGNVSDHLTAEIRLTRYVTLGAFLMILPFSYYVFFSGSDADC